MRGRRGGSGWLVIGAALTALALLGTAEIPRSARAQRSATLERAPITVRLEPPAPLVVGARAEVIAHVRLEEGAGRPMLLTPSSEGTAVDVVRGRLTRADAEDAQESGDDDAPHETPRDLRFRIPLVARTAGTAVVRVRVDGFACREGRCRALQIEESVAIEVLPAPTGVLDPEAADGSARGARTGGAGAGEPIDSARGRERPERASRSWNRSSRARRAAGPCVASPRSRARMRPRFDEILWRSIASSRWYAVSRECSGSWRGRGASSRGRPCSSASASVRAPATPTA